MSEHKTPNAATIAALARGDLSNAMVAATPGGIEQQEKAGQTALVQSTDMPLELAPSREAFEAVGFTFGEPIDSVFQSATLPPGWSREATDHAMHSHILDDKGRRRVEVFYKAAFYDRRADARLVHRYTIGHAYADEENGVIAVTVDRGGRPIKEFGTVEMRDHAKWGDLENAAKAWLADRYPNHADPTAYWDEPAPGATP